MISWCNTCKVPIFDSSICPLCENPVEKISPSSICNPVFIQEKRLLSYILNDNVGQSDVWYLGSGSYLIDGKRIRVPLVSFISRKNI